MVKYDGCTCDSLSTKFTYVAVPAGLSMSPTSGPTDGGRDRLPSRPPMA